MSATTPQDTSPLGHASAPEPRKCSGPCGRLLPPSSFGVAAGRKDGRRKECRECHPARRGARGRDGQRARSLERELLALLGTYSAAPLSDVLSRALAEVRQVGAAGAQLDEQVEAVRRAVVVQGCRSVDEVIEETRLSRWAVGRALERLVEHKVVETRDRYLLADEAAEAGRPVVEYHPATYPRGEGFSRLFRADPNAEEGDLP
jgi:hypothetical protein